jgi:hypothetical protein
MLPTQFPEANFTFLKPEGMTDEECMDLPVWKGSLGVGTPGIISCWKFAKEDLEEINRTGVIYLSIVGSGMPPVSLFTENPWTDNL